WRRVAHEYVGRERHQFCCVSPHAAGVAPTKACLDLDVATVCPSQLFQALLQRCQSGLSFLIVGRAHQQPDPPHALALLRARRERPRSHRAAEQRYELAALDPRAHSMTSSGRACSLSGIWRPSDLAVVVLMISWNLVGCSTGRSAGLAPLRIRPV